MTAIEAGRGIAGAAPRSSNERIGPFGFNTLLGISVVFGSIGLVILTAVASSMSLYRLVLYNELLGAKKDGSIPSMPQTGLGMGNGELWGYITAATLIILSSCSGFGAAIISRRADRRWSPRETYDRYLVGVGFCLVLLALLNFVALCGFAKVGQLWKILGVEFSQPDGGAAIAMHRVLFLILAPGFAVLGALFFHANSLRTKRERLGPVASSSEADDEELTTDGSPASVNGSELAQGMTEQRTPLAQKTSAPATGLPETLPANQGTSAAPAVPAVTPSILQPPEGTVLKADASATFIPPGKTVPEKVQVGMQLAEPFNQARFWGGLWFRMGEALVFALVVFLVGAGASAGHLTGATLLLITLLMGMFVKSGEGLITGVADKLFTAVKAMVK